MDEVDRLNRLITRIEADRDRADAELSQVEEEWTQSGAGDDDPVWRARHDAADQELRRIQEEIDEAEGDFQRAVDAQYDIDDEDEEGGEEALSLADAALIWKSRGMDEDYTFGYTEDELRQEL